MIAQVYIIGMAQKKGVVDQPGGCRPLRYNRQTDGVRLPFPEGRSSVGCPVTASKHSFPAGIARQSFAFALVKAGYDFAVQVQLGVGLVVVMVVPVLFDSS
jgi:hypothetical protein